MTDPQARLLRREVLRVGLLLVSFMVWPAFGGEPGAASSLKEMNPPRTSDGLVVIRGATVLDGRGGPALTGAVVIVRGAKIATVGGDDESLANAEMVDGTGMTLLPGMIDSHFHIERDYEMPRLVLSHGVTWLRDPGQ